MSRARLVKSSGSRNRVRITGSNTATSRSDDRPRRALDLPRPREGRSTAAPYGGADLVGAARV